MFYHIFYLLFSVFLLPYLFFRFYKTEDNSWKDSVRLWIFGSYLWVIVLLIIQKNESVYFNNFSFLNFNRLLIIYKEIFIIHISIFILLFFPQLILTFVIELLNWRFKTYSSYIKEKNNFYLIIFNLSNIIITTLIINFLLSPISEIFIKLILLGI
jgi:hypothetical protein